MSEIADVRAAAGVSVAVLAGYTDLDWQQVSAAELEWSCWQSLSAHADLLQRISGSAAPDVRAHHNYGVSDPAGFAAMGVVETLIHTFDVVRGLNPADQWRPPTDLAVPAITRLFPHAPSGAPADVLLYCCGRAALGELPRQTRWQWDGTVRS